jgi:hypothetical protein
MKLKLNVPDTLNDITLAQYVEFDKVNVDGNQDTVFLMQKTVEIFCRVNLDLTLQIKYNDLVDITQHIYSLLETSPDLAPIFKIDDVEYGFIPKLDDITLGEYIDLDNYLGDWQQMHKAMSVLYRPIKFRKEDRYLIEDYDGSKYADVMQYAPLGVVIGAMVFFWDLKNELLNLSLNSLEKEMGENLTTEQLKTLEVNGVGISQSLHSLTEILKDLKISQNSMQSNA